MTTLQVPFTILGSDEGGKSIVSSLSSLTDHLTEESTVWQRLNARIRKVYLGKFRPNIPGCGLLDYYLLWCSKHKKFFTNYPHGYDRVIFCPDCENERLVLIQTRAIRSDLASRN